MFSFLVLLISNLIIAAYSTQPNDSNCDPIFEKKCEMTGECIPNNKRCDGHADCPDLSDEQNCGPCNESYQYQCNSGDCIKKRYFCDTVRDCRDNSDEVNCVYTTSPSTPPGGCDEIFEKRCEVDGQCIPNYRNCDGFADCLDSSDEQNCRECDTSTHLQCNNRRCIKKSWVCDGADDCGDNSDEENCNRQRGRQESKIGWANKYTGVCDDSFETKCRVTNICLPNFMNCNGKVDCPDGSDEQNC